MWQKELSQAAWLAELVASMGYAATSYARGESNERSSWAEGCDGFHFYVL